MDKFDSGVGMALGLAAILASRKGRRIRTTDPGDLSPAQKAALERREWNAKVEAEKAQKKQTKALREAESGS